MSVTISTAFVLVVIAVAYNRWGNGNWGSTAIGFMLACSLVGTAWAALGKQAGDTTRDVVVSTGDGIQAGLGGGGKAAAKAPQPDLPEVDATPPAGR